MKKAFCCLIVFLVSYSLIGKIPVIIEYSISNGLIYQLYFTNENGIYCIKNNGKLDFIILGNFNSIEEVKTAIDPCRLSQMAQINQNNIQFYFSNATSFDYYDHFRYSRKNGWLAKLDELQFDYYDFNYFSHKNGYLSQVGIIQIDYFDQSVESFKNGKTARIGSNVLDYHDRAVENFRNGKLKQINGHSITYYDKPTSSWKNGKVERIGGMLFEYFDKNGVSYKNGKLKSISGNDAQIELIQIP